MNSKTEKVISTGLALARDAGAAAMEAGGKVGTNLVKVAAPKAKQLASRIKEAASVGAGLAIAKRGGKAALAVVRKNKVATAAAAVALAGVGVAVVVARKRKAAKAAASGSGAAKPKKVAAKNMRGNGAAPAKKAAAKKTTRSR